MSNLYLFAPSALVAVGVLFDRSFGVASSVFRSVASLVEGGSSGVGGVASGVRSSVGGVRRGVGGVRSSRNSSVHSVRSNASGRVSGGRSSFASAVGGFACSVSGFACSVGGLGSGFRSGGSCAVRCFLSFFAACEAQSGDRGRESEFHFKRHISDPLRIMLTKNRPFRAIRLAQGLSLALDADIKKKSTPKLSLVTCLAHNDWARNRV